MRIFITVFALLLLSSHFPSNGQMAIKLRKQQTDFFYFQLNTHYGKFLVNDETRMGLGDLGSSNQIAFQWLSKNQKRLQRGYTKSIEPGDFFLRINLQAKPTYVGDQEHIRLRANLITWMSILTKWDRTKLHVGIRNLPYGHNPRIDADFTFISPQVSKDLGFSRDFGLFVKTPVTSYLDLESALTLGGYLSRPIAETRVVNQVDPVDKLVHFNNFNYLGTWLVTNRIGVPSFESVEYGLFLSAGHIYSSTQSGTLEHDVRFGGDLVLKQKDVLKLANQVTYGFTNPDENLLEPFRTLSIQSTIDLTYFGMAILSLSHDWQKFSYESGMGDQKRTLLASVTFVATPDIKVKLNGFKRYQELETKDPYGFFWQAIIGIGDRK